MEENNIAKSDGKHAEGMTFPEFAEYVRDNLRNEVLHVTTQESGRIFIPSFDKMMFHGDFQYGKPEERNAAYQESYDRMEKCANRIIGEIQSGFPKPQRESIVDGIIGEFGYEFSAYALADIIENHRFSMLFNYEEIVWAKEAKLEMNHMKPGFHYVPYMEQMDDEPLEAFTRIFRERSRKHDYELANFLTAEMTPMLSNSALFNGEPSGSTGIYFQNNQVFGAVTPVIPLQDYYNSYLHSLGKSTTGLDEALRAVAKDALFSADLMPGMMGHMELTAERKPTQLIYLKAANTAANPPQDSGSMRILSRQMGDISLQMQMVSFDRNGKQTSIALRGFHQKLLGSTEAELYQLAMENTRSLFPPVIKTMGETLEEFRGFNSDPDNKLHMHVIMNERKFEGASFMFDPSVLSEVSALYRGDDLFLMPSSIHESLAMPAEVVADAEDLAEMVREVNEKRVSVEERLSNIVYLYDAMDRTIRPAVGMEYGDIKDPALITSASEPDMQFQEPSAAVWEQQVRINAPKL